MTGQPRSSDRKALMIYITAVHMADSGGGHEHIDSVRWEDPGTGKTDESTRSAMVRWINDDGDARVRDAAGHTVRVGVVDADPPYIRTYADKVWTDNLLALPRY
jgi:hypothetical protein